MTRSAGSVRGRGRRRLLAGGATLVVGAAIGGAGGVVAFVACSSGDDSGSPPAMATTAKDATASAPDVAVVSTPPSTKMDAAPTSSDAGDAGAADGGRNLGTDRSTFFGASRCAGAGLLFCDGFEQPALDGGDWSQSVYGNGTTITVDPSQAARGGSSIHVVLEGNGASELVLKKIFPITGDRYFGRVFTRFHLLPRAPMPYAHWTFAAATGTGAAGETRLSSQLERVGNLFGVGTDTGDEDGGTGDWTTNDDDPDGSPRVVPTDEWLCIEWMNDGTADQTRFWWDGVEHPSLATSRAVHGGNPDASYELPDYTQAWIGFAEYQDAGNLEFEAWYDEIAYDTQRIGCTL